MFRKIEGLLLLSFLCIPGTLLGQEGLKEEGLSAPKIRNLRDPSSTIALIILANG